MDPLLEKKLITTKEAGEISGYSSDYLARLARSGKIAGRRIGHSWFVERESLTNFLGQQGDRKVEYARALARKRETEYREHHSVLHVVTKTLSKARPTPPKLRGASPMPSLDVEQKAWRSHFVALATAFIVVGSGAYLAYAAPFSSLGAEASSVAREFVSGFSATFGTIPSRIAARINDVATEARSYSSRAASNTARGTARLAPSFLAHPDFSALAMEKISGDEPMLTAAFLHLDSAQAPLVTVADVQASFVALYELATSPSLVLHRMTNAYSAVGNSAYAAILASLSGYRSLIMHTGAGALAFGATARDAFATAPTLVARMNLGLGNFVIAAAHTAIRADVATAYGLSEAAPAAGHLALSAIITTGDTLARATETTTVRTPVILGRALRSFSEAGPALARAVFDAEYAAASRFVAASNAVSGRYLAFIYSSGRVAYSSALAVRDFGGLIGEVRLPQHNFIAILDDAYLATLGKTALALRSLEGLAAAQPALSAGENVALFTYETLHSFFSSTSRMLANLFSPPAPIIVQVVNGIGQPLPVATTTPAVATKTPSSAPSSSTLPPAPATYSYPTYTTIVQSQGISENFMSQSLAALRADVLATVSGMIQPVSRQIVTNIQTIQEINRIEDLTGLIVRDGDFRGGTLDNAIRVSADDGNFTRLVAGNFSASSISSPFILATNASTTNATTTGSFALTSATPARLLNVTVNGVATSTDLSSWLAGTDNQVTLTDNGAGGLTASLPSLLAITNASSTALSALNYVSVGTTATSTIAGDGNASTLYGALTVTGTSTQASALTLARGNTNGNNTLTFADQTGAPLLQIYTDANTGYGRIVGDQSYLTLGTFLGGTALTIDSSGNTDLSKQLTFSGDSAGITFTGTGNHDITASAGSLRLGANTIIGNIQALDDTVDIGTPATRFDKVYANEVNATTLVGSIVGGNVLSETLTINQDNTSLDQESSYIAFERGSTVPNAMLTWNAATSSRRFEFNQPIYIQDASLTSATSTLFVQGWSGQTSDLLRIASSSDTVSPYLTVTSSGNVGIGTASPSGKLHIDTTGNDDALIVNDTYGITGIGINPNSNAGKLWVNGDIWVTGAYRLRFGSSHSLAGGIGGQSAADTVIYGYDSDAGDYGINFVTGADQSSKLRITNTGNVGIGTTSPVAKLHVTGGDIQVGYYSATDSNISLTAGTDNDTYLNFNEINANYGGAVWYDGGDAKLYIGTRSNSAAPSAALSFARGSINTNILGSAFITGNASSTQLTTTGSTYLATTGGNVGIGTTSPLAKLDVLNTLGGSTPLFSIASSTNGAATSTALYVAANGNVGIGTAAPAEKLDVQGNILSTGKMYFTVNPFSYTDWYIYRTSGTLAFGNNVMGDLAGFQYNGNSGDRFGIGSSASSAKLHVWNNQGSSSSGLPVLYVQGGSGQTGDLTRWLDNAGNGLAVVTASGNVGIGTTTPGAKLDIWGNLQVGTSSTPALFVNTTNGKVAIGGSNPQSLLEVWGPTTESTPTSGTGSIIVGGGSGANSSILFQPGNTIGGSRRAQITGGQIGSEVYAGYLAFSTRNIGGSFIEGIRIDNTGNVGIGTTSPYSLLSVQATAGGSTPLFSIASSTNGAATSTALYVAANGNVGIGTSTPWGLLSVNANGITAGAPQFVIGSSTRTDFIVTQEGNVGIGTASPGAKLDIIGNTKISGGAGNNLEVYDPAGRLALSANNTGVTTRGDGSSFGDGYLNAPSLLTTYIRSGGANVRIFFADSNMTSDGYSQVVTSGGYTNSTGIVSSYKLTPTVNQTSTGGATDFLINRTETALGSGSQLFIDTQVAGVSKFNISNTGYGYFAGNVGIGTTSPYSLLSIQATAGGTTPLFSIASSTAGAATSTALYVAANGNVGIGTTAPGATLDIKGASGATSALDVHATNNNSWIQRLFNNAFSSTNPVAYNYSDNAGVFYTGTYGATSLNFVTNSGGTPSSGTRMTILSGGNIGIGTTSPFAKLSVVGDIYATGGTITASGFVATSSISAPYFTATDASATSTFAGGLAVDTSGLVYDWQTGNVGVGTASPSEKLEVVADGNIKLTTSGANSGLKLFYGATQKGFIYASSGLVIDTLDSGVTLNLQNSGGTVSIGTTKKLSIAPDYAGSGELLTGATVGGSATGNLFFVPTTSGTNAIKVGAAYYTGSAWKSAWEVANVASGFSDLLLMKSGGNVGIGTASPGRLLDVNGIINATTYTISDGSHTLGTSSGYTAMYGGAGVKLQTYSGSSIIDALTVAPTSGNVGIGTTTPSGKLAVSGGASIGADYNFAPPTNGLIIQGNVGIGTTSPTYKLDVAGLGHFTGLVDAANFTATSSSATSTFAGGFVVGQCVTGDTRLRRRKKRSDGSYEYDEVDIQNVATGDEIASLDESTGRVVYSKVKTLMDMGEHEVFELVTKSGRKIRTTANHPYLARMKTNKTV